MAIYLRVSPPLVDPSYPRFYVLILDDNKGTPTERLVAQVYGPSPEEAAARGDYIRALLIDHPVVSGLVYKESIENAG